MTSERNSQRDLFSGYVDRRKFLGAAGLGMAGLLLSPTRGAHSAVNRALAGTPKPTPTLTAARGEDVVGWYAQGDEPSILQSALIYRGLTIADPKGQVAKPAVATSWNVSHDQRTYTFHLRPGVKFSDGTPLTSADVINAITVSDAPDQLGSLMPAGMQFVAPDASTVVVHTKDPAPYLLESFFAVISFYPEAYYKKVGLNGMNKTPLSCGPFVLDSWTPGSQIVYKPNPYYWETGKPYIQSLVFEILPDSLTRILSLQAGQIDIALDIPPTQVARLKKNPNLKVLTFPAAQNTQIRLCEVYAPFQDRLVRQAINYAVDKNAIIKNAAGGYAKPSTSVLPGLRFTDTTQAPYPYDVARAKQLMAKSKHPKGFSTTLLAQAGDAVQAGIATIVQSQLKAIGIKVSIESLESGSMGDAIHAEKYQMAVQNYTSDILDPSELMEYSSCGRTFVDSAHSHYYNPQINKLFFASQTETKVAKRAAMYKTMQQLAWNDAAFLFLYDSQYVHAVRSNVNGFTQNPLGPYALENTWKS